jgi:PAS domain S-box-containing protein
LDNALPEKPSYEGLQNRIQVLESDKIELMNSKDELELMFSMLLDMICIADLQTACFLKVNQAFTTTLGYPEEELIGRPFFEFIHSDDIQSTLSVLENKLRAGTKVINFENRYQCKDGSYKLLNWVSHPNMEKGVIYAIARDITQIKQTEISLRESEQKYKGIFNYTNDGICLHEIIYRDNEPVDYRILDVNPKYEEMTNIKGDDAIGSLASHLYNTSIPPYLEIYAGVARTGRSVSFETYFPPMKKYFMISVFTPSMNQFVTVFQDITKRKRTEKALLESESRYKSLFHNNHAAMLLINPENGEILDANPAAVSYYGWPYEEITRKKILDINVLTEAQVFHEMEKAKMESRKVFHFKHRIANGNIRDVEVYSGPITIQDRKLLYSIVHDITERIRAEEERTELISKLQNALKEIKTLRGILPICASCNKIRDDKGYWNRIEAYIHEHSEAQFSHGICPDCMKELYPEYETDKDENAIDSGQSS